ncbi:MAG: helix-turn-helix transcriptional regulator [Clostridia bacterium]|nr:helix-turn-helix transcriptional regulator [Clostridia bacterium]
MSKKKLNYKDRYKKLGLKIQYYRKIKGYTQETFAEAVDISASFVSQIESVATLKGISLETLFRMAEVLEVEPYQLLKED